MASKAAFASGVIEMLKEDHQKVKDLFEQFESAEGSEAAEIAATAIMELAILGELDESSFSGYSEESIRRYDEQAVEAHHLYTSAQRTQKQTIRRNI